MSDLMQIHPAKLQVYIELLRRHCGKIAEEQAEIAASANRLGDTWDDKIYCLTLDSLRQTATYMKHVHDELRQTIKKAIENYNAYMQIQEYRQRIDERYIAEYEITLRRDVVPDKFHQTNRTDLVAMKQFIDQLDNYITSTQQILKEIIYQHDLIGREKAWVAPQYNQLSGVLEETSARINAELNKLRAAHELTYRKFKDLCDLYNVTF